MEKKTCFVVTPIGNSNTEIRRHIDGIIDQAIIPALKEKYDIEVAHRKYEIGSITDKIISSIYNADLVIANLTTLNPNVMFELAIRYSFGKPAIVIAESGTKLPFDVNAENTIFYINDPAGAAELKDSITKFESAIDFSVEEFGPVFSALKKASIYNRISSGEKDTPEKEFQEFVIERLSKIEGKLNTPLKSSALFVEDDGRILSTKLPTGTFGVTPGLLTPEYPLSSDLPDLKIGLKLFDKDNR